MNLFMKKADTEPKIKVPASIERQAKDMLDPEEKANAVVVDRLAKGKCPKCGGDLAGGQTGCICEKKAADREIQMARNPKWEGNGRRPCPPAGYAPLKLLGKYANQHVCPNCGTKGAGIVWDGGGFQDTKAQKFYEQHCGEGSYDALCKQFEGDMIKCHWSRFGTGYFTCCEAKIWHDMVNDQQSGKWKDSRSWRYYYRPTGQKSLASHDTAEPTHGADTPTGSGTTYSGQLDNQNKAEKNSDASAIDTNNGVDGECGKYAAQSGLADHVHIPTICPMCKQDKQLQWVNPGSLGPNTEICRDCVPRLFAKYGYREPGYKIIDEETVQIFSQTTGWETIKVSWVKEIIGNTFPNDLFPLSVMLEHEQIREVSEYNLDHETFGVTWAAARLLSVRAGVAMSVEPSTECSGN